MFFFTIISLALTAASYYFGYQNAENKFNSNLQEPLDTVYAIYGDKEILASDVEPKIRQDLLNLKRSEYALKKQAVVDHIKGLGIDALIVSSKQTQDDEKEFQKYLKERNIDLKKLNDQAKADIQNMFKIHSARIRESQNLKNNIQWKIPIHYKVKKQVSGKSFVANLGNANAPAKVILFTNYYCIFCDQIYEKINLILDKYAEQVSLEIRFNMQENESSIIFQSAMGTGCAAEQNKTKQFINIFSKEKPNDLDQLLKLVNEAGLDGVQFKNCLDGNKYRELVNEDLFEARRLEIVPRPVFYINGYELSAQDSMEEFLSLLFQK